MEDRCLLSTLTVTSNSDDGSDKHSLRYAVAHAQDGDKIQLTAAVKGDIVLTHGELILNHDVTIQSVPSRTPTISGDGQSRVFEVAPSAHVKLVGLNITGGNGLAGDPAGDTGQDGNGGAILDLGTLTVNGCSLTGNSAGRDRRQRRLCVGWAIFNRFGTLTVGNSTLSGNSATNGGGIADFGAVTVTGSTSATTPRPTSVGISIAGDATISGSTFSGDSAANFGGGVFFFSGTL